MGSRAEAQLVVSPPVVRCCWASHRIQLLNRFHFWMHDMFEGNDPLYLYGSHGLPYSRVHSVLGRSTLRGTWAKSKQIHHGMPGPPPVWRSGNGIAKWPFPSFVLRSQVWPGTVRSHRSSYNTKQVEQEEPRSMAQFPDLCAWSLWWWRGSRDVRQ